MGGQGVVATAATCRTPAPGPSLKPHAPGRTPRSLAFKGSPARLATTRCSPVNSPGAAFKWAATARATPSHAAAGVAASTSTFMPSHRLAERETFMTGSVASFGLGYLRWTGGVGVQAGASVGGG